MVLECLSCSIERFSEASGKIQYESLLGLSDTILYQSIPLNIAIAQQIHLLFPLNVLICIFSEFLLK